MQSAKSTPYFNCTIQELKQGMKVRGGLSILFQLHHTGIKTIPTLMQSLQPPKFQLHHTGIKTGNSLLLFFFLSLFQLHHTGIKTDEWLKMRRKLKHFNCTIQELKLTNKISALIILSRISIAPYRN